MKRLLLRTSLSLLWLCWIVGTAASQSRYYDMWYFGGRQSLDFRGDPVAPSSGPLEALEGCSSICDPNTGAVLFYTNGATVWNRRNQVMRNGADLHGNLSCTQSSLIVPHPGNSSLYYIFTLDGTTSGGPRGPQGLGLRYSTVDMGLDGGMGEVVLKNVVLLSTASEKITAVRHRNGCAFWIITHELNNDKFYAWLLTENGLYPDPVVSSVGRSYNTTDAGYLKASPDGSLLFAAHSFVNYNGDNGELFGFDYGTGVVGPLIADLPAGYGASFSPNNNFLYTSRENALIQYDLRVPQNRIASTASLLNVPEPGRIFYGMQIGPDGKVYVIEGPVFTIFGSAAMKLAAVTSPNSAGTAAGYAVQFNYPSVNFFAGLPNCIDAYLGVGRVGGISGEPHELTATDTVICFGEETQLRVSGGRSYRWSPSESLNCDDCPDPVARPVETTTYQVEIYDDLSCRVFDTLRVTVRVKEIHVDAGPDTTMCVGGSLPLHAAGGGSYRWTPSAGLSCTDCPNPIAAPDRTTTYYVTVTDEDGCVALDSVRIVISTESSVRIGTPDTTLSCGESLTLKAPGGKDYFWSTAVGLSCDDCAEPVASPQETTTYYLSVVDSLGCTGVDSITVRVVEGRVDAGADTALCVGESIVLSATGRKEYLWNPADGLSCTDCPNPVASPTTTTTYIVRGTTNDACLSFDTVVVTVHDFPAPDLGEDRRICLGDSVRLNVTGGVYYAWTPVLDINCMYCPDQIVFPKQTMTYYVEVRNEHGCVGRDSIHIVVQSGGNVRARGDTAFCPGGSARLSASGAVSYRWSPSEGLSCTDCANPTATPEETTTYYVIGINAEGECPVLDSVVVRVRDLPVIDAGADTAVCVDGTVRLTASGGVSYRWDPSPELSCLDCADPIARPAQTTTYYVTGANADGCASRDSVRVEVRPGFVVNAGEDRSLCIGESAELSVSGGVRWRWEPSDGLSCVDCSDPIAAPVRTTLYRVTAWSADGCVGSDSVEVGVREEPEVIRLRIGRGYHGRTGEPVEIGVEIVGGSVSAAIAELELALEYDSKVMVVDAASIGRLLAGTALADWSIRVTEEGEGKLVVRLTAPAGARLAGSGDLLRFESRLYLSSVQGTELSFTVSTPGRCFVFETEPGYARVDSVCGLNFRLIELTGQKYAAPIAYPNPARDRVQFEFGLGLDGPTRLEVFDLLGNRVGLILSDVLQPGRYAVEWDVRDVPSGLYWYRLTSGDWSGGGQLRVGQ